MLPVPEQVHRGIKGVVKDSDGNGIKGATISVRGIRKDVTTGKHNPTWLFIFLCHAVMSSYSSGAYFLFKVNHVYQAIYILVSSTAIGMAGLTRQSVKIIKMVLKYYIYWRDSLKILTDIHVPQRINLHDIVAL